MSFDLAVTPLLAAALWWLARVDAQTLRLPDSGTLSLVAAGLALSAWRVQGWPWDEAAGAVLGYLAFFALGEAAFRMTGREALGLGDAKLFAAAGAWLGWRALPWVLLIAALVGLLWVAWLRLRGRDARREIPFGPSLAAAFFAVWCTERLHLFF